MSKLYFTLLGLLGDRAQHAMPYTSKCPISMNKNWRQYIATVSRGEARILQAFGSDVSLETQESADGVFMVLVHTENSGVIVKTSECFIGPQTEMAYIPFRRTVPRCRHTVTFPHCIRDEKLLEHIRVKQGNIQKEPEFQEMKRKKTSSNDNDCYEVTEKSVIVHAIRFKQYVLTLSKPACYRSLYIYAFGHLEPMLENDITTVKLSVFLCSNLYAIEDYKQVKNL